MPPLKTQETFKTLSVCSKSNPIHVILTSCYGGAANTDARQLPKGSTVITFAEPDEMGNMKGIKSFFQPIEQYINKGMCSINMKKEFPSPHQTFMDWMFYAAVPATGFSISQGIQEHSKTFTYRSFDRCPIQTIDTVREFIKFQQGNFTNWYKDSTDPDAIFLMPREEITEQEAKENLAMCFRLLIQGYQEKYLLAFVENGLGKKSFIKEQIRLSGSLLLGAARSIKALNILIEAGADVNEKDEYGHSPLHLTARRGYLRVAKLLIEKGANLEAKGGTWEETPLSLALRHGKLEMATFLIEKGANLEAKDTDKATPLHVAAEKGNLDVAIRRQLS